MRSTTRVESASSSARCCVGVELVVDEQHLGAAVAYACLQLLELALADVRPRVGPRRAAGRSRPTGSTPAVRASSRSSASSSSASAPFGSTASSEPALGLGPPGGAFGLAGVMAESMPRRCQARPRDTLSPTASRRTDARARRHPLARACTRPRSATRLRALVPRAVRGRVRGRRGVPLSRASGVPASRSSLLAGHYDTVPAQDNVPGRIEDGAVLGCGASDMKGGVAVASSSCATSPSASPGRSTSRSSSSAARSCRRSSTRSPRSSTAARSSHEADLAVLLEPTDLTIQAGCVGNLNAARHLPRAQRPFRAALARGERDPRSRSRAWRRRGARAPRGRRSTACRSSRSSRSRGSRPALPTTSCPTAAVATLNLRYPPDRTPARREEFLRALVPTRLRRSSSSATRRRPPSSRRRAARRARCARPATSRRAEAGVDERRRLHDARHPRRQLRPRCDALRAPPRRARRDRRARAGVRGAPRVVADSASVQRAALPRPQRARRPTPSSASTRPPPRAARDGLEVIDFGMGDPREPTDPAILRGAARRACASGWAIPAARRAAGAARGGRGLGRRAASAWRSTPSRHVIPTLGSKEAIFSLRQVVLDVAGGRDTVVVTEPGYPVRRRGAQFAGARRRRASAPRGERLPARPRRRPPDDLGPHGARLAQLRRTTRPGRSRRSRFYERWPRSRASTASSSPPTRRTPSSGSTSRRRPRSQLGDRTNVARLQHALEALLDDRLPLRLRRRRSGADRRAAAVPAERRDRAAGVRPARLGRRLGRRGARRAGARRVRGASASLSSTLLRAQGPARRRRAGDDVPLDRGARAARRPRAFAARLLEHGVLVAPGSFLGPSGEGYVRYALVPTEEECERAVEILEEVL